MVAKSKKTSAANWGDDDKPETAAGSAELFTTDTADGKLPPPTEETPEEPQAATTSGDTETAAEHTEEPKAQGTEAETDPAPAKPTRRKRKETAEQDEEVTKLSNMRTDLVAGVERIERLAEEVAGIKGDMKELFDELKSKGYTVSIIRKVIARRAMDPDKRAEQDSLIELYEEALG